MLSGDRTGGRYKESITHAFSLFHESCQTGRTPEITINLTGLEKTSADPETFSKTGVVLPYSGISGYAYPRNHPTG